MPTLRLGGTRTEPRGVLESARDDRCPQDDYLNQRIGRGGDARLTELDAFLAAGPPGIARCFVLRANALAVRAVVVIVIYVALGRSLWQRRMIRPHLGHERPLFTESGKKLLSISQE